MSSNDTSKSPPRHWHGTVGDRYEHHNVWVTGSRPQAYRPSRSSTSTTEELATGERRVCLTFFCYRPPLFLEHLYLPTYLVDVLRLTPCSPPVHLTHPPIPLNAAPLQSGSGGESQVAMAHLPCLRA